jgi:UDP-2,3-diacylglucosamine pyrophosphatase LpxH
MPIQPVAELLASCESTGAASQFVISPGTYREQKGTGGFLTPNFPEMTDPVPFTSDEEEIFVISDLHIAAGTDSLGVYSGLENFFADQAFDRFLTYSDASAASRQKKALLVINGDTFDFLRVTDIPSGEKEIAEWQQELQKLTIDKTTAQLSSCISARERKYGLETDDYKTIFKLMAIRKGHPLFFTGLARWISKGHRLLILKGNHDLEIVWPAVRNYIRLLIGEAIDNPSGLYDILRNIVLPRISFIDDAVLIDGTLYLEHGHRYDKFTMVLDSPYINRKGHSPEINIPFGSFFNRYLINRVELAYPYMDKVRPTANILPILLSQNLPLALKMFGSQLPLFLRILFTNRRYIWFMFRRVVPLLLAAIPVILYIGWLVYPLLTKGSTQPAKTGIWNTILATALKSLGSAGSLILSYFLARLVGWLQLTEPSSLDAYARHVCLLSHRAYPVMSMGHTHNPSAYDPEAKGAFYNTGTWIPVIETSTLDVREDKMYTFLHLERDRNGGLVVVPNHLERWNDDGGRPDPQLLIRPK